MNVVDTGADSARRAPGLMAVKNFSLLLLKTIQRHMSVNVSTSIGQRTSSCKFRANCFGSTLKLFIHKVSQLYAI